MRRRQRDQAGTHRGPRGTLVFRMWAGSLRGPEPDSRVLDAYGRRGPRAAWRVGHPRSRPLVVAYTTVIWKGMEVSHPVVLCQTSHLVPLVKVVGSIRFTQST